MKWDLGQVPATPFYFYDIHLEVQQPIKIHPFAVHDYGLLKYRNRTEAFSAERLYLETKKGKRKVYIPFFQMN